VEEEECVTLYSTQGESSPFVYAINSTSNHVLLSFRQNLERKLLSLLNTICAGLTGPTVSPHLHLLCRFQPLGLLGVGSGVK